MTWSIYPHIICTHFAVSSAETRISMKNSSIYFKVPTMLKLDSITHHPPSNKYNLYRSLPGNSSKALAQANPVSLPLFLPITIYLSWIFVLYCASVTFNMIACHKYGSKMFFFNLLLSLHFQCFYWLFESWLSFKLLFF